MSSATPGFFDPDRYPFQPGVIEAFCDQEIETITMMWATQIGKTALLICMTQLVAGNAPAPMMFAHPSMDSADKLSDQKLLPSLRLSAVLRDQLPPEHLLQKRSIHLPEMVIDFGWSGSPATFGEKSRKVIFCTELDKWSLNISQEADPAELVRERVKAFATYKIVNESTPTLTDQSRIAASIAESDDRHFHVPCPRCGAYKPLEFDCIQWPQGPQGQEIKPSEAVELAYYKCQVCDGRIDSQEKPAMIAAGVWARRGETVEGGLVIGTPENPGRHAGFTLSSLYSMHLTFGRIAEAYLRSRGNERRMQNFVNSWLAKTYTPSRKNANEAQVLAHCGDYPRASCPIEPTHVIAAVDVQKDFLKYIVRAFDANDGATSYLVRYGRINTWDDLERLLQAEYAVLSGGVFRVTHCFIDSGFRTEEVFAFCNKHDAGCFPVKGAAGTTSPWSKAHKVPGGDAQAYRIADAYYKSALLTKILDVELGDPGAWWLYDSVGMAYARELTAEVREEVEDNRGYSTFKWRKLSGRQNDFLDCEKIALAAADMLRIGTGDEQPEPRQPRPVDRRRWASKFRRV